jgi:hypothetical protein
MQIRVKNKKKNTLARLILLYLTSLAMPVLAVGLIFLIAKENETRDLFDRYGVNTEANITDHWTQKGSKGGISAWHISYTYTVTGANGPKLYSDDRKVTEDEYKRLASQSQVTIRYLSYQPQFSRLLEGEEDFVFYCAVGLVLVGLIELVCIAKIVIHQFRRSQERYHRATWGY